MSEYEQTVFISYAWGGEREEIVNQIDQSLQERGINITRDKRDLGYKGSIKEFMERIGQGHCIIVVVSDKYLRSPNCMFELVEIAENKQFHDRIFPVVLTDADIYDPVKRLEYVKHWETKRSELAEAMRSVDPANLHGIREDIDMYDRIRDKVSGLTSILKDMNTLTPEMHRESNFSHLYDAIEKRIKESLPGVQNQASLRSGDVNFDGITAQEVKGNVVHINVSPEAARQVNQIAQMQTSVPDNHVAGMGVRAGLKDLEPMEKTLNELLGLLKDSGKSVNEIQTGDLHISQVELLLKKAILVKTEADQMYFDQMDRYKKTGESGGFPGLDLEDVFGDFDEHAHKSKLMEAHTLLREANMLDPANTEVLLLMAQLLIELTPDDPSDELELLYRVQNLLQAPKNDSEKFRLAQATFLIATAGETIRMESLRDARAMFMQMGRAEWVRQCDELLSQTEISTGRQQSQNAFQPIGNWQIQVHDAVSSTMSLRLHPDGAFEAVQQFGPFGASIQAVGQWVFVPMQQLLQLQGLINGFQPFMLGISIQSQQGNAFHGTGNDGFHYTLSQA
ncbi:MAG: TIR domain-containing protein [Anaerolineales bacterium]|nr:TIR domain-containing protein [Anaerolineales bacterium]